jgi:hypothetical protein
MNVNPDPVKTRRKQLPASVRKKQAACHAMALVLRLAGHEARTLRILEVGALLLDLPNMLAPVRRSWRNAR